MAASTWVELCRVLVVIASSATSCRGNNGGPMIESISSGGCEADAENFCPILNPHNIQGCQSSQLRLLKDIPTVSCSLTLLLQQIFVWRLCIANHFHIGNRFYATHYHPKTDHTYIARWKSNLCLVCVVSKGIAQKVNKLCKVGYFFDLPIQTR
jgi:hypothetical protein